MYHAQGLIFYSLCLLGLSVVVVVVVVVVVAAAAMASDLD